jgi:hypothetical protein
VDALGASDQTKYLTYGFEVSESGTPHLQGFVIFGIARRLAWVKAKISDRVHLESTIAKSHQARDYCHKDDNFKEFGEFPGSQGKRSDLDDAIEWCDKFTADNGRPPTSVDLAKKFPSIAVKYGSKLLTVAALRAPDVTLREGAPRPWQLELEQFLGGPADDRQVRFYVDPVGNTGKSWFQGYYCTKNPHETQLLGLGKRDDIAFAIDPSKRIFFFNVPRGDMQYFQYTVLEQLKDKVVFSTKYQSTTKLLRHYPHVIIFCNEEPDMNKMSVDRYDVRRLTGDTFTGAFAPGFNDPSITCD